WSVRFTSQGHRHGHGLIPVRARNTLWAYFGDTTPQCGVYKSLDGGATWTQMLGGQEADVVDATPLADDTLLFGQDISYVPPNPGIARIDPAGRYTLLRNISGPAYSTFQSSQGVFVFGASRESGGDVYSPAEVSAH